MTISRLIRFTSKDVFANLAAEELLFQRTTGRVLLFYVNNDSIVLGRTQNPLKECDVAYAAHQGVSIARRRSGGGTVVHDSGNLNFSFIRPREEHEPFNNAKLVASVLKDEFGINATVNKRADILVEGKKVSGAAYRLSGNRAYHHGTLLINSNLDKLRRLLKSPLATDLKATGTASVRSSVTNLSNHCSGEITADAIINAIADRFAKASANVTAISPDRVEREFGGMQAERGEICSHAWVYGKTPSFSFTSQVGSIQLIFSMAKGTIIRDIKVKSIDSTINLEVINEVEDIVRDRLSGHLFDGPSVAAMIANCARSSAPQRKFAATSRLLTDIAVHFQHSLPFQFWKDSTDVSSEEYN